MTTPPKLMTASTGPTLLFVACGHKAFRAGAQMRGNLPWRCPACVTKRKEQA